MKNLGHPLRTLLTIALLALAVSLASCSDTPRAADIEQALQNSLDERFGLEALEVSNVKILKSSTPDPTTFRARVRYILTFPRGLDEYMDQGILSREGMTGVALQLVYGEFKKGDKREEKVQVNFSKDEDGWRLTGTR